MSDPIRAGADTADPVGTGTAAPGSETRDNGSSVPEPTRQLFAVKVNRDDTVCVVAATVTKETPKFYFIEKAKWGSDIYSAFGYSNRIDKSTAKLTARQALETYMAKRQWHKAEALSVVGQATKQIASANEALMRLPAEV